MGLKLGLIATAALCLVATPVSAQAPATPQMRDLSVAMAKTDPAQLRARLQTALAGYEARDTFAGVVLLSKGDDVLYEGAFGQANRDWGVKNTLDTRFNLASASKMFTAVAILQLAEKGKLKLDDPIGKHLDESWVTGAAARDATVAQLLTHTGGFGSYFGPDFDAISPRFLKTNESFKPLIVNQRLQSPPGAEWGYSNTGFLLLGVIVQKASGQDYDAYLRENIFAPLGMKDTGALDLEQVNPRVAVGYDRVSKLPQAPPPPPPPSAASEAPPAVPPLPVMAQQMTAVTEGISRSGFTWRNNIFRHVVRGGPAGGFYSTAADMRRFLDGVASAKILKRETVEAMTAPKPKAPHWGYGVQLEGGAWGHTGGYEGISVAAFALPDGYRMIVMSNTSSGSFAPINAIFSAVQP